MTNESQSPRPVRGRPFQKGQSGNPKGRPKGSRNKTTLIAQALLDGEAEALVRKVVQLALEGDPTSLRICLERLVPLKKDAPIDFSLPEMRAVTDIQKLFASVAAALDQGRITPSEARILIDMAGVFHKLLEVVELEPRISALEEEVKLRSVLDG
jgi:hypothetical protein